MVTLTGSRQIATIPRNGMFSIDVDNIGIYTAAVQVNNPYYTYTNTTYNFSFSGYFDTVRFIDFPVRPIPNKKDITINLVAIDRVRPGFNGFLRIIYKNVGTTTISSGEILLAKDSRVHYGSANPAISGSVGDTLKWAYTNLAPGDSSSILLNQEFDVPPTLKAGDTLKYIAIITPVTGDETPSNDTARLKLIAVSSFDPNDKTENNGGIIGPDYVSDGKYLNYTIRFQNTGTDTAFNVIVRDTLDSKLDWSTFEMVVASHPYTVSITNQNKIEWAFSNINLPDSNVNEPLSHGYVSYRVKPKSTVVTGDIINNLASIYFDFNLPVATNNATTLILDNSVILPIQLLTFTGQVSNNIALLEWKVSETKNFERFEIERSLDGRTYNRLQAIPFNNSVSVYSAHDNISALPSKQIFYRLKLVDADGKFTYSKIIVFKISISSNITIYPNPAVTEIFISLSADKKENLWVKVIDAAGRTVMEQQKEIQKGNNVFPVNTSKLRAGNYILQILADGKMEASKLIITN